MAVASHLLLPPDCEERELKELMAQAEAVCASLHIQIAGGHTEVTDAVNRIVLTCVQPPRGRAKEGDTVATGTAKPGNDIVMTKWISLEETSIAARKKEKELQGVSPHTWWRRRRALTNISLLSRRLQSPASQHVCAMTDVTEHLQLHSGKWRKAQASDWKSILKSCPSVRKRLKSAISWISTLMN